MRYVQIRLHGETLSGERKQQLMEAIQQALNTVTGHDDVPACISIDEVPEANWRLMGVNDDGEAEGQPARAPTVTAARATLVPVGRFDHRGGPDFGDTGIIAHLAGRPGQPYRNPAEAGLITVRASSVMSDSAPPSAVVGNEVVRFCTRSLANSWVEVDFGQYRVAPTHYALRHYSSWDSEALRSWTLEGSDDGSSWRLLSMVENDASLNRRGATHTWPVNGLHTGVYFRYLRLTQRGPNANQHHYLALSGLELHGLLARVQASPNPADVGLTINTAAVQRLRTRLTIAPK